jgi:hypothetical protein
MSDHTVCEKFADNLAELALGILTGRERMATLAHVESCAHCADELEALSWATDAMLHMAPEVEPPLGFEVSLFSRMGVDELAARRQASRPRWILAGAAAVVVLAVGLGVGLSVGSSSTKAKIEAHAHSTNSKPMLTASLTEDGSTVGVVSLYGGSTPVLTMELAESSLHGIVTCEIVTDNGVTHKLGTFKVTNGYGAWVAPLGVSPDVVRTARLVSPDGTTIATATLS